MAFFSVFKDETKASLRLPVVFSKYRDQQLTTIVSTWSCQSLSATFAAMCREIAGTRRRRKCSTSRFAARPLPLCPKADIRSQCEIGRDGPTVYEFDHRRQRRQRCRRPAD